MLIRQFNGVVIIATKVAFASLPSPPFRSEPVGMTVRTHVAHDLNAIPMRLAVLVVVKVLVVVSPCFLLVLGCECNPGPRRERGVQASSALAGTRKATRSSRLRGKRRLSFWVEGA
jgi:hypothetical protein